jgi:hypothetical protein
MNKLGKEQQDDIAKILGILLYILIAETKKTKRDLFDNIQERKYTYILLSLEQVSKRKFREIL